MRQIIVELSEEQYEALNNLKQFGDVKYVPYYERALANGILLPEHYGRLGDLDALEDEFSMLEKMTNDDSDIDRIIHKEIMKCWKMVMQAPTIIPATGNEFFNFDAPFVKASMREGESNADSD